MRKKALRALFALKKHANREYISPKSLLYLFDSLIKPFLLYGSQILLPHTPIFAKINQLDGTSNTNYFKMICQDKHELFVVKYLKWVLGVHRKASNVGVYGETGKLPLYLDGIKLSCDYYDRCKNSPDNSLVKKAFLEQKRLDLDWYHNITELLAENSSGPHSLDSLNVFQNLKTRFIENWTKYLKESPKLEFYNTVKNTFKREEYLDNPIFKYRTALCRLRISAHNLEIELGRYAKKEGKLPVSRAERFCRYCQEVLQIQVVESEQHVLNDCPLYIKHRQNFMSLCSPINTPIPAVTEICEQVFTDADSNFDETLKTNIRFQLSKLCHNIFIHRKVFHDFLDDYIE